MMGISWNNWPADFKRIMALPARDERKAYARQFYRDKFWVKAGCDILPARLDIAVFDFAVHSGVARATKMLAMSNDWRDYILGRMEFLASIGTGQNAKFLRGWMNRCLRLWRALSDYDRF